MYLLSKVDIKVFNKEILNCSSPLQIHISPSTVRSIWKSYIGRVRSIVVGNSYEVPIMLAILAAGSTVPVNVYQQFEVVSASIKSCIVTIQTFKLADLRIE